MANILLVDDDLENLWALQLALEADGHRVVAVEDAGRALDLLRREPVHFMITDYEMPLVDGAQLCRMVRAWGALSLPIVMLSAAPEPVSAPGAWAPLCGAGRLALACHHRRLLALEYRLVIALADTAGGR